MSHTSPSTTASSEARSPEEKFRVRRKRNRVPLSCNPCRAKKKCDRNRPCGSCLKKQKEGTDENCVYATPSGRKRNQSREEPSPDDMQNRINRLEGLVLALMNGSANVDSRGSPQQKLPGFLPEDDIPMNEDEGVAARSDEGEEGYESNGEDGLAASLGILKLDSDRGKALYLGQEHWHTILSDITEVKNYFASHKKELETGYEKLVSKKSPSSLGGPTFLFGAPSATAEEIRSSLPDRPTVSTLCTRFFDTVDFAVGIVHRPTFVDQLLAHWQDPSKTSVMWLGLLYSVMCLAMLSYHKVGDAPPEWRNSVLEKAAHYRLRTVQCLVTADFTKPGNYTVETLLLYVLVEHTSRFDADVGIWLIVSMISRIAFRMGYHRDAKWFPLITPFQAEMRRRVWAVVRIVDIMYSSQLSLPNMIHDHDCDAQHPNNILDEEFGPESKVLPASRPGHEPTPISYIIAKARFYIELGNILHAVNNLHRQITYDEALRFDARLREMKRELPPHLRLIPLDACRDPVGQIMTRFRLDILYQQILCLLHRKFLVGPKRIPRFAHSRRSAIDASLELLSHLAVLHRESQPGGRLACVRGHINSIATREFLLAAMLIMLELHSDNHAQETGHSKPATGSLWSEEQRLRMVRSLEETRDIWRGFSDASIDAFKATNVLGILLEKINGPPNVGAPTSVPPSKLTGQPDPQPDRPGTGTHFVPFPEKLPNDNLPIPPGHALPEEFPPGTGDLNGGDRISGIQEFPALGLGHVSLADLPGEFVSMNPGTDMSLDPDMPLDWDIFENYTQGINWGGEQAFSMFTGDLPPGLRPEGSSVQDSPQNYSGMG